ncbi:AAA family ATPase [Candidatus Dependentiae bacterium]|nr:AAA family ATPase [Candidatus Dependentiae bacterium]
MNENVSDKNEEHEYLRINTLLPDIIKKIENRYVEQNPINGVPTGFRALDDMTSGFQNSDLIIIASRPSMGKTSLALNIAYYAARVENIPVMIFSLELNSKNLIFRLISNAAIIELKKIMNGLLNNSQWERLIEASEILYQCPVYIDNSDNIDIISIIDKIKKLKQEKNIGLVIIDYLQLIKVDNIEAENNDQVLAKICRALKNTAEITEIPIIVLSQLKRPPESRIKQPPLIVDLDESGIIEEIADVILLMFNDKNYPISRVKGMTEINIVKHKNGPRGKIYLHFLEKFSSFENYDNTDYFDDYLVNH